MRKKTNDIPAAETVGIVSRNKGPINEIKEIAISISPALLLVELSILKLTSQSTKMFSTK